MNDNDDESSADLEILFGRLSALEFILEVLLANLLASHGKANIDAHVAEFDGVLKGGYGPITADPDVIARMQRVRDASERIARRLVAKAQRRAHDLAGG